jgi:hypothetical protein
MLRYYAIATAIVLVVVVLATMRVRDLMRLHFRSSNAPQPAQHLHYGDTNAENDTALEGDAPWALSALPDCFMQQSEWAGTATYVDAHLPHSAQAVAPGTTLAFGPCTISVRRGEVFVSRGSDRFRIPPYAVLYRSGAKLWLLRRAEHSSVLRSYTLTAKP